MAKGVWSEIDESLVCPPDCPVAVRAVYPGVSVTVTSIATNQTRTVVSAEDGVYRVPLLDPGAYRVRFSAPGFKTKEVMSVTLAVTDTVALDLTLEVGATSEEITVEAVAETIQTSTYDSSYGRNPGANVNVVTKSGSNEFHGSLFEFFRNEHLNANDFFYNRDNPLSATRKQILRQNQFGGTLGGPVKENKLFFFGSYQGTRQFNGVAAQGITSATLYPVPDNREAPDFPARLGAATCGFATRGGSVRGGTPQQ